MTEAAAALAHWSTNHCQSARVLPRDSEQSYRWEIAEHIAALQPASVLELGCSSGRNLAVLRTMLPTADLVGIDPNAQAVAAGRSTHPSIVYIEGDDRGLPNMPDASFDVVLSCSVLDHIPAPKWSTVYDELVRIAKVAVVLLEPMVFRDGDVEVLRSEYDEERGSYSGVTWCESKPAEADFRNLGIAAPPFTYAHDYLGHDPLLRIVRHLPVQGLEQWASFGSLYYLLERRK